MAGPSESGIKMGSLISGHWARSVNQPAGRLQRDPRPPRPAVLGLAAGAGDGNGRLGQGSEIAGVGALAIEVNVHHKLRNVVVEAVGRDGCVVDDNVDALCVRT